MTQGRLVGKEEKKERKKMTHTYTFLKISFLGGGIDTKIFVDRKKLSYFGQCAFVFGAKKQTKTNDFLFLSFLFCLPLPRLKVFPVIFLLPRFFVLLFSLEISSDCEA